MNDRRNQLNALTLSFSTRVVFQKRQQEKVDNNSLERRVIEFASSFRLISVPSQNIFQAFLPSLALCGCRFNLHV